jgi:restriction system protein
MSETLQLASAIPPYHQMLWPTLQALKQLGDSGSNSEIEDLTIDIAEYTPEQQSVIHGDGSTTEIRYRMAWARTYLKNVGAIQNSSKGVWSITEYGKNLDETDMAGIPARVKAIAADKKKTTAIAPNPKELAVGSIPKSITSTNPDEWRDHLLSFVLELSPSSFEKLSQRILRESGFTKVEIMGRSGDGGIDGIGVLRVALLSFHVLFQCKRYTGSVGPSAIRDFRGAMVGRTDKGLFITTGTFTADAKKEATRDGAPVIDLIDGSDLCDLLKSLGLGVTTRQVEEITVLPDWFKSI